MRRRPEGGFTYLGVLFIVSLLGLTSAMASVVWSTEQRRENERELLFAGRQFQWAIERYGQRVPGEGRRYPERLEDLLRDPRAVNVQRHLRQIYEDPMTHTREWGLIRLPDGGIVGVHSLSTRKPLSVSFASNNGASTAGETYREWRFIAQGAEMLLMPAVPASAASATSTR